MAEVATAAVFIAATPTAASEHAPKQVSTRSPTGGLDWGLWENDVGVQLPWREFHLLDGSRKFN